ncbi:hypothetical protein HHI36_001493 [Cryptolaemus montrouzieri]|uniref:Uncharacterized protein n=1 Tax=Cryptolaemus montrouzieri TaxID=559131 RepID=A0ABD2P8J2_9CUCU
MKEKLDEVNKEIYGLKDELEKSQLDKAELQQQLKEMDQIKRSMLISIEVFAEENKTITSPFELLKDENINFKNVNLTIEIISAENSDNLRKQLSDETEEMILLKRKLSEVETEVANKNDSSIQTSNVRNPPLIGCSKAVKSSKVITNNDCKESSEKYNIWGTHGQPDGLKAVVPVAVNTPSQNSRSTGLIDEGKLSEVVINVEDFYYHTKNNKNGDWTTATYRKNRTKKQTGGSRPSTIKGINENSNKLEVAQNHSAIFVTGYDPDVSAEDIIGFLKENDLRDNSEFFKMKTRKDVRKSCSKLVIPLEQKDRILSTTLWSSGISVSRKIFYIKENITEHRDFPKINLDRLRLHFSDLDFPELYKCKSVDVGYDMFTDLLMGAIEECCPVITVNTNQGRCNRIELLSPRVAKD